MQERKQDTREKIQLGGLVVKAGLRNEDKAVLLGVLMEAAKEIRTKNNAPLKEHYRKIGEAAFNRSSETE